MNVSILDTQYESKEVFISSSDYKSFINNEYVFKTNSDTSVSNQYDMRIAIKTAEIPVSFYNINENNNRLKYSVNDVVFDIIFDIGNYNVRQFLEQLNTKLQAQSHSAIQLDWDSKFNKIGLNGTQEIKLFKTGSTCFTVLGFTEKDHVSINNVLTSDSLVDIRAITRIYVHCNLASEHTKDTGIGNKHDILGVVPVTAGSFGTIIYQPMNPLRIKLSNNHFQSFKISFKDENGRYIDFNNMKWQMTIEISFTKKKQGVYTPTTDSSGTTSYSFNSPFSSEIHQLDMERTALLNSFVAQNV